MRTLVIALLLSTLAAAQGTRTWEQTTYANFEKGTAKGVALRSDGALELAPAFKQLYSTPATYVWAMAADRDGNVYAATGAPARVYRITPKGEASVVLAPEELQVQALAIASDGSVYAATNPDGKVYRIERKRDAKPQPQRPPATPSETSKPVLDPAFESSVYLAPGTKYIWSLAADRDGTLYVATGDRGEIYKVTAPNRGAVFFKSDESHVRTIVLDHERNLVAGAGGGGLLYRINQKGEGFVLYSAPKEEITALAVDAAGNLYAAAVGERRTAGMSAPGTPGPAPAPQTPAAQAVPPVLPIPQLSTPAAVGGSEIYRIATDGSPTPLWSSRDELVYALGFDSAGTLIAGTGNKGRILAIRKPNQFTILAKATATQVTAFATGDKGQLFVGTSNLGRVFAMGPSLAEEGTFESDVFDARNFARWGRLEVRGRGNYELFARSGNLDNPDRNWSPWQQFKLDSDEPAAVPSARFVQWKAVLVSGRTPATIESVTVHYLPKNVAPQVSEVVATPGFRYANPPRTVTEAERPAPAAQQGVRERGHVAVRWSARDDNDDTMSFSVYYRGDNETRWKLLKDGLLDRFLSFESGVLPDGGYTVRVVATDAPSHTATDALSDEAESRRFEVDNTAPVIDSFNVKPDSGAIGVTFRVRDSVSAIRRAEYSLDGGEWQFIEPVGQLTDARTENYDFSIPVAAEANPGGGKEAGEHLVTVRVWDRAENLATEKKIVRGD